MGEKKPEAREREEKKNKKKKQKKEIVGSGRQRNKEIN
jgi:hypothetical protein